MTPTRGDIIDDRFVVGLKIGSGRYATVFAAQDRLRNKPVAIKVSKRERHSRLEEEHTVYQALSSTPRPLVGIPHPRYFTKTRREEYLITDLCGKSLHGILRSGMPQFGTATMLKVGVQMINRLQFIHMQGFVHMDIKPDNIMIGTTPSSVGTVFLADFGSAVSVIDPETKKHIAYRHDLEFTGSFAFASGHTHFNEQRSYRDDLEALAYVLIFLHTGSLPWLSSTERPQDRVGLIGGQKRGFSSGELCNGMPRQMSEFCETVRNLKFGVLPNYDNLRSLLREAMKSIGAIEDGRMDWMDTLKYTCL